MDIIARADWGARPPRRIYRIATPTPKLYLHHSAGAGSDETAMRAIQDFHMDVRDWSDFAYSFAVDDDAPDVDVFEGRGAGIAGGHTAGQNTASHAICVIGNFTNKAPHVDTLEAVAELVVHGYRLGWWPDRITGGHRDAPGAATTCPGDALWAKIPDINERVRQLLGEDDMSINRQAKADDGLDVHADAVAKAVAVGAFTRYTQAGGVAFNDELATVFNRLGLLDWQAEVDARIRTAIRLAMADLSDAAPSSRAQVLAWVAEALRD